MCGVCIPPDRRTIKHRFTLSSDFVNLKRNNCELILLLKFCNYLVNLTYHVMCCLVHKPNATVPLPNVLVVICFVLNYQFQKYYI